MAGETWEVKIVPELNHDLFSFKKSHERWMADEWEMERRRLDH